MTRRVIVEACVETAAQAVAAASSGADRVELCRRLDLGGLTPAPAELTAAREALRIPLQILIRPRAGDFAYTAGELEEMVEAIGKAKAAGADGIVTGVLTAARTIDKDAMRRLLKAARPLSVTFHRAFDDVPDQQAALAELMALGVDRVLTSGGAPTALDGAARLHELVKVAGGRIIVMAGGSVRPENVVELARRSRVTEVHARMDDAPGRAGEMKRQMELV